MIGAAAPFATLICARGASKDANCWPCRKEQRRRASVALCDGPPAPASKRLSCDMPICGEHRHHVGPNRDLCPDCSARAATASAIAETYGEADDEIATLRPDDRPMTLFDVALDPTVRRIR